MADTNRNLLIFPNLVVNDIMSVTVRTFMPSAPDAMDVTAWEIAPRDELAQLRQRRLDSFLTFLGPAGVGDLFATAASKLSRNYRLGYALGQGRTLADAVASLGQVAEGVPTSHAVGSLAKRHSVDLPVFAAVEAVLAGHVAPQKAVALLMERVVRMDDFAGRG